MTASNFYEELKNRLHAQEWMPGQQLPSIRSMVSRQNVSFHNVATAYARLATEGAILSRPGRGYFVAGKPHINLYDVAKPSLSDPLFTFIQSSPAKIKLGSGWLPSEWHDSEVLARAIRRTARVARSDLSGYGDIQGYLPLRLQLSKWLQNEAGIDVSPASIVTSLGATQALDLALRLLVKPGDRILIDEPGNGNLIKLIEQLGGKAIGVARLQEGPDLAELKRVVEEKSVIAYVCNTTFHNPTGSTLRPSIAVELLRLAAEYSFKIIEDDVYGDFSVSSRRTLAELDGLHNVIYIGSFSKTLSASLRVGYLICPEHLIEPIVRLKFITSVAVPSFCERFINTLIADGTYRHHLHNLQQRLLTHQAQAQRALRKHGWRFDVVPDGGMSIWVHHPDLASLTPFIRRLERNNVLLIPGPAFSAGRDYRRFSRINCAHFSSSLEGLLTVMASDQCFEEHL